MWTEPLWGNPLIAIDGNPVFGLNLARQRRPHVWGPSLDQSNNTSRHAELVAAFAKRCGTEISNSSCTYSRFLTIKSNIFVTGNSTAVIKPSFTYSAGSNFYIEMEKIRSFRNQSVSGLWSLSSVCKVLDSRAKDHFWKFYIELCLQILGSTTVFSPITINALIIGCLTSEVIDHVYGDCLLCRETLHKAFTLPVLQAHPSLLRNCNFLNQSFANMPTQCLMYQIILISTFWRYRHFKSPPACLGSISKITKER